MSLQRFLIFTCLIIVLTGCNGSLKPEELPANIKLDETYFSQMTIRYEKGVHQTTNFRRGFLLPVNTPVKLVSISAKIAELQIVSSNQPLIIKNIPKHTNETMFQAFARLFGGNKVNLNPFTGLEKANIEAGTVVKGMRKKGVLVALGYPPKNATPTLKDNQWTYWSSRFNKFNVIFQNDKVAQIVD